MNIKTSPVKTTSDKKHTKYAKEKAKPTKKTPARKHNIFVEVRVKSPPKNPMDLRNKITATIEVLQEDMDTTEDPPEAAETPREPEDPNLSRLKLDHVFGCNDFRFKKFSN